MLTHARMLKDDRLKEKEMSTIFDIKGADDKLG
jgi:hypothetical protein